MRPGLILAGSLLLTGCATASGPERLARLDAFLALVAGTWVSVPGGDHPDCPQRTMTISVATAQMRSSDSGDRWLISRTAKGGVEQPGSRHVVFMHTMAGKEVVLMPFRGEPADLIDADFQAKGSRLAYACDAQLTGSESRMRLSGCGGRDPGDWLASDVVALSGDEMLTRVRPVSAYDYKTIKGGCRFQRQRP